MPITISSIYHETNNFFRNQFVNFLIIALFCTITTIALRCMFSPSKEQIDLINKNSDLSDLSNKNSLFELVSGMTPKQKRILLQISAASAFSSLIGNVILIGGVLLLIQSVSAGYQVKALRAINSSFFIFPKLFILIFLIVIFVELGLMFLVVPGIFLAIAFSFSPIIIIEEKSNIFIAILKSVKLSWKNMRFIAPAIISWFFIQTLLLLLFKTNTSVSKLNFSLVPNNFLSNLASSVLLIYLFRLYSLTVSEDEKYLYY